MKTAFSWTPLGMLIDNWDGVANAISHPLETAKDLAKAAWAGVKAIFIGDWLPDFFAWETNLSNLTGIDWASLISLQGIKAEWNSVTSWFGNAAAGIWDAIPEMPSWLKDAFSMFENQPQVDIEKITRQSVVPSGSVDRSQLSEKQLEVLRKMEAFRAQASQPIQLIQDPKTLLAAADAATKLEKQFPALSKAADAALKCVWLCQGAGL